MTAVTPDRASRPAPRRRPPIVPHQHGAWAFLALPVLLAVSAGAWDPTLALLAPAWIAAYPLSWALSELWSARHPERYRRAAVVWAAVLGPLAVALVVLRPWLWVVGLAYGLCFAANVVFARAGAERSLRNDLLLVLECSLMVPVTVAVAEGSGGLLPPADLVPTGQVAVLTLLCALALTGSTLHVKSLIRERRDPRYRTAARWFAVGSVPVVVLCAWWWGAGGGLLVPSFVLLALRTWPEAIRTWRPARVGLLELAGFVLVAGSAFLAS